MRRAAVLFFAAAVCGDNGWCRSESQTQQAPEPAGANGRGMTGDHQRRRWFDDGSRKSEAGIEEARLLRRRGTVISTKWKGAPQQPPPPSLKHPERALRDRKLLRGQQRSVR